MSDVDDNKVKAECRMQHGDNGPWMPYNPIFGKFISGVGEKSYVLLEKVKHDPEFPGLGHKIRDEGKKGVYLYTSTLRDKPWGSSVRFMLDTGEKLCVDGVDEMFGKEDG